MKVVLLNSGGKDSLAVAILLKAGKVELPPESNWDGQPVEVHSLYVDLGWRNVVPAKKMAKRIADAYCASHEEVTLSGSWLRPSPPAKGGVVHQSVALAIIGAMYATQIGATTVLSGLVLDPKSPAGLEFPGSLLALYKAFADLFHHGAQWHHDAPALVCPLSYPPYFSPTGVTDVVKDDPLFLHTVTCSWDPPCGTCFKCEGRRNTLIDLGKAP